MKNLIMLQLRNVASAFFHDVWPVIHHIEFEGGAKVLF